MPRDLERGSVHHWNEDYPFSTSISSLRSMYSFLPFPSAIIPLPNGYITIVISPPKVRHISVACSVSFISLSNLRFFEKENQT